jgi:WD40 repeat protein
MVRKVESKMMHLPIYYPKWANTYIGKKILKNRIDWSACSLETRNNYGLELNEKVLTKTVAVGDNGQSGNMLRLFVKHDRLVIEWIGFSVIGAGNDGSWLPRTPYLSADELLNIHNEFRLLIGEEKERRPVSLLFQGHKQNVNAVKFFPDGQRLVSGSDDGTIKLWDALTGQGIDSFECEGRVNAVAISPGGSLVAGGGTNHVIEIFNLENINKVQEFRQGDVVTGLSFSPDGRTIASSGWGGTLVLWNVETGEKQASFVGHSGDVTCCIFIDRGKTLVSGGKDGSICFWDVESGQQIYCIKNNLDNSVTSIAMLNDGERLAIGQENSFAVLDIKTNAIISPFPVFDDWINATCVINDDELYLAAGSSVYVVGVDPWRIVREVEAANHVQAISIFKGGSTAAIACSVYFGNAYRSLCLFDVESLDDVRYLNGDLMWIHNQYIPSSEISKYL